MRDTDWSRKKNLNIGCGEKEYPGCVNIDKRETAITHFLWDLNVFPYPFPDDRFERVYAQDIIEHLDDVIRVMEEIHRVLEVGGEVHIRTAPWGMSQSYNDPTHKHWFTKQSFDFFDPDTEWGQKYDFYTKCKFKVLWRQVEGYDLEFVLEKR